MDRSRLQAGARSHLGAATNLSHSFYRLLTNGNVDGRDFRDILESMNPVKTLVLKSTLLSGLLTCGHLCAGAEQVRVEWWKTDQELTGQLFSGQKDIFEMVRTVQAQRPDSAEQAMLKLMILLRAGLWKDALAAVDELHVLSPRLEDGQISAIYYAAGDQFEAWEVAQRVVEVFGDEVSELSLDGRLLRHFKEAGWSVQAIDEWLAARPPGRNGFWIRERLRFAASHGHAEALIGQLSANVRAHPDDAAKAIAFLDAVLYARGELKKSPDLSWLAQTCQPKRATDAQGLARRLQELGEPAAAASFYRTALGIPLTDREVGEMQSMIQAVMPGQTIAANFLVQTKEGLSACLLELGDKPAAQRLMEEAVALRRENQLGSNMQFAGQTQAATGARTVENTIRAEEKISENDPRYWLERAAYFRGRKNTTAEEEAYRKALSLTTAKPPPEQRGKGFTDLRSQVVSAFDRFLTQHQREDEAVTFLVQELADAPPSAVSAESAARLIAFEHAARISPDTEACWRWLAGRPKWQSTEERLLWELLKRVERSKLDPYLSRAEKLAAGADPSRNLRLGWILNRMNFAARSIPLLVDAAARIEDDDERSSAQFTLLESYLDTTQWQPAEAIFPAASRRLTGRELPSWHAKIAVAAARSGATEDALRIWKSVVNINPCCFDSLDDLARAGMAAPLREIYDAFAGRLPDSVVPQRAREIIQKASK